MRHTLFCSWDLSEHEKWISPSPNLDGLPVGRHFQNVVNNCRVLSTLKHSNLTLWLIIHSLIARYTRI